MNETEETSPFDAAADEVSNGADPQEAAARLVALLSEDELLGMLDGDVAFWPGLVDMTAGGYHSHPWPAARVERLGIPGLEFSDGPRGVVIGSATCFPVSMARGGDGAPAGGKDRRVGPWGLRWWNFDHDIVVEVFPRFKSVQRQRNVSASDNWN